MKYFYHGREVEVDIRHHKDPVDSYINQACYIDNGQDLSEDDLEKLQDLYSAEIYQDWYEYQIDRADMLMDMDR